MVAIINLNDLPLLEGFCTMSDTRREVPTKNPRNQSQHRRFYIKFMYVIQRSHKIEM